MIEFLKGKKTYVLAIALVAYSLGGYLTGHFSPSQALDLLFGAGFASSIRAAIQQ